MCLCLETMQLGVQCCKDDDTAEVVAGILLLYVCKYTCQSLIDISIIIAECKPVQWCHGI